MFLFPLKSYLLPPFCRSEAVEFRRAGAAWLTRADYGIPGARQLVLYKLNLYRYQHGFEKKNSCSSSMFFIFINEPWPATPGMPHRPSLKSSGKWVGFRPSPNLHANKLPTFGKTKRITPISWIPITLLSQLRSSQRVVTP